MNRTDIIVVGVLAAAGAAWWLASPAGQAAATRARAWWDAQQPAAPDVEGSPLLDEIAETWTEPPAPAPPVHDRLDHPYDASHDDYRRYHP